jgi:hypothetical protein
VRFLLPFWRGVPERCFYQDFHAGIAEAMRESGHDTSLFIFDRREPVQNEEAARLVRHIAANRPDAILDLACWGFGLTRVLAAGRPLLDATGIAYIGWLFDQPWNQQMTGAMASRRYAIYPDLGHPQQVRMIYPGLRLTGEIFAPPAIRAANDRSPPAWFSDRDTDVLYVGNLEPDALTRPWRALGSESIDPIGIAYCDTLADAVVGKPDRPLHLSMQRVLEASSLPPGFNLRLYTSMVERFLRHSFRHDAVRALARSGIRLRIVGDGWGEVDLPNTVQRVPPTDYEGLFAAAARARICLDASTYLDGANDRVFSYALNRSVCFTNAAGYLGQLSAHHPSFRFYSMDRLPDLCDQVKWLLGRPGDLREAGESAKAAVLSAHAWRHRVAGLPQVVRSI